MDEKEELLKLLSEVMGKDILVIVEGFKDRRALNFFDITNVITLSKNPLYKVVESIYEPVIILTDLDKKGKELYCKLN